MTSTTEDARHSPHGDTVPDLLGGVEGALRRTPFESTEPIQTEGPATSGVGVDWYEAAACRLMGVNPDTAYWWPSHQEEALRDGALKRAVRKERQDKAEAICQTCPVRQTCWESSLDIPAHRIDGIVYGYAVTQDERERLSRNRRMAS